MYLSVIPHITDAIQEWVEHVAKQPVSDDGVEPNVNIHNMYYHWLCMSIHFCQSIIVISNHYSN